MSTKRNNAPKAATAIASRTSGYALRTASTLVRILFLGRLAFGPVPLLYFLNIDMVEYVKVVGCYIYYEVMLVIGMLQEEHVFCCDTR
jgi:hypothetical protein